MRFVKSYIGMTPDEVTRLDDPFVKKLSEAVKDRCGLCAQAHANGALHYFGVGAAFALLVFAISVVSIPMMLGSDDLSETDRSASGFGSTG